MYAVSAAGLPDDGLTVGDGLGEDGAGVADEPEEVGEAESEGDGKADGDALGDADPVAPDPSPVTVWPGAIVAVPVVTNVREPSGGGTRPGTGALCPLRCTVPAAAWVSEAGT